MIISLSIVFAGLITAGTLLTLLLFRFNIAQLQQSGLLTKILMWVPLGLGFLLVLRLGDLAMRLALAAILVAAVGEFRSQLSRYSGDRRFLIGFLCLFVLGFAHLSLLRFVVDQPLPIILVVIVGTVIADVGGFFIGRNGRYKLPATINAHKSWEGVGGQLTGALIGVALIGQFVTHESMLGLALPIGLGAALGDLMNSRAKRLLNVKNWSNIIPGHGGVLDRFCSLAGSSLITLYWLLLFGYS